MTFFTVAYYIDLIAEYMTALLESINHFDCLLGSFDRFNA